MEFNINWSQFLAKRSGYRSFFTFVISYPIKKKYVRNYLDERSSS